MSAPLSTTRPQPTVPAEQIVTPPLPSELEAVTTIDFATPAPAPAVVPAPQPAPAPVSATPFSTVPDIAGIRAIQWIPAPPTPGATPVDFVVSPEFASITTVLAPQPAPVPAVVPAPQPAPAPVQINRAAIREQAIAALNAQREALVARENVNKAHAGVDDARTLYAQDKARYPLTLLSPETTTAHFKVSPARRVVWFKLNDTYYRESLENGAVVHLVIFDQATTPEAPALAQPAAPEAPAAAPAKRTRKASKPAAIVTPEQPAA